MTLLCLSSGLFELSEELSCDVSLEASGDLAVGFSFASPAFGISAGGGVGAEAGQYDYVDGSVELPVS